MSKSVIYQPLAGKEKFISQNRAYELRQAGKVRFLGKRDGFEVITERPEDAVFWNGSCRDRHAMHRPGEVRS